MLALVVKTKLGVKTNFANPAATLLRHLISFQGELKLAKKKLSMKEVDLVSLT